MKVRISRDDNQVSIDGRSVSVDCSVLMPNYQVLFWDGGVGYIQTRAGDNLPLKDLKTGQSIINAALKKIGEEDAAALPKLADAITQRRQDVDQLLFDKRRSGVEVPGFPGKFIQVDDASLITIFGAAATADRAIAGSVPWAPLEWWTRDNSVLVIATAKQMLTIDAAAKARVQELRRAARRHKDAIGHLPTIDAVMAYDIRAGW